jgi:hypothetical protein
MIRINFWIIWAFKPNIRPNMIHSVGKKKRGERPKSDFHGNKQVLIFTTKKLGVCVSPYLFVMAL